MIDGNDFRREVLWSRTNQRARDLPIGCQPIGSAEGFKLAIAGGAFTSAGNRVLAEEKRRQHSSMLFDPVAVGLDFHPLFARPNAGSSQDSAANIDNAHSTHPHWPQPWVVAQRGYGDAVLPGSFPDRCPVGNGDGLIIDGKTDHRAGVPLLISSGQWRATDRIGFSATWPKPHSDV